jgi:hypothetical protein
MAILEIGINLGTRKLLEIRYYSSGDNVLDPSIRARFLNGLEDFVNEVFGDEINVISLVSFEIICYYKMVQISVREKNDSLPLLIFAIIEKGTDHDFVTQHLKKIYSCFLENYNLNEIFMKKFGFFKEFEPKINKILGDLRFKLEDRIKTIFKES